ncbi:MAG: hypothetical protein JWO38_2046 [Gemmataceae bacterium]|nr:hypothetical protein [Gemmataceae bacterium]
MSQQTISGVVREILTADPDLPADEVIKKALGRGLTASPKAIREAAYNARSDLRKAGKVGPTGSTGPAGKAAPAAAKPQSVSSVVRSILATDLDLPADDVIRKARARGLAAPPEQVRRLTKNLRSEMKKAAHAAPAGRPAPAAARAVPAPLPAAARAVLAPVPPAAPADLAALLATVALVDRVVGACGGSEPARQVAEAVRVCGGVDAFLQHVELVSGIRSGGAAG